MKCLSSPRMARSRGMTFIELTVTIAVLLILLSATLIGARAWKRGGDRTNCLLNIRNMQSSTRSYQNLYGYAYGSQPQMMNGTQDIGVHLWEKGYIEKQLLDQCQGKLPCPGGGNYHCTAPHTFPEQGQLYITCSVSGAYSHAPERYPDW